jgi:hypothetical protein
MTQSTQRIIDNIRKVAGQMDAILQRDLLEAASRLQEQADLIERMQSDLAQAISERTQPPLPSWLAWQAPPLHPARVRPAKPRLLASAAATLALGTGWRR